LTNFNVSNIDTTFQLLSGLIVITRLLHCWNVTQIVKLYIKISRNNVLYVIGQLIVPTKNNVIRHLFKLVAEA